MTEYLIEFLPLEEAVEKSYKYEFKLENERKQYELELIPTIYHGLMHLKIVLWE